MKDSTVYIVLVHTDPPLATVFETAQKAVEYFRDPNYLFLLSSKETRDYEEALKCLEEKGVLGVTRTGMFKQTYTVWAEIVR